VLAHLTELARAVERVDDPHARALEPRARVGRLLDEDAVVGIAAAHEALQIAVGCLVADIGELVARPTAARAQREDALARGLRRLDREVDVEARLERHGLRGHGGLIVWSG